MAAPRPTSPPATWLSLQCRSPGCHFAVFEDGYCAVHGTAATEVPAIELPAEPPKSAALCEADGCQRMRLPPIAHCQLHRPACACGQKPTRDGWCMDCWVRHQQQLTAARKRDEAVARAARVREMLQLPQLKVLLAIYDMRKARGRAPTVEELVMMSRHPEERVLQHLLALKNVDFARATTQGNASTLDVTKEGAAFVRELRGEEGP